MDESYLVCPWCEKKRVGVQALYMHHEHKFVQYVECGNQRCRATGPKRKTERGAITAGNRAKR